MANTKELMERLNSDSEFAQKFTEAVNARREAGAKNYYETVIPTAAEFGYEVTEEELDEINEQSRAELTEEELGKVAGGTSCLQILSIVSSNVTGSSVIGSAVVNGKTSVE